MLTPENQARITGAVHEAEVGSSGDIFCVLAGEVSSYREVPIACAAAAALLIPPIVLAFGLGPLLTTITAGGWTVGQSSALQGQIAWALSGYAIAQMILFALVAVITSWAPVRRAMTPGFLKRHRVQKAAFHHFAAAHTHVRDSDTGILIFVALVERRVEVLADAAIHAKAGDAVWRQAADAVQAGMQGADPTAGILEAIALCGAALKTHFPSTVPHLGGDDRPMEV